VNVEIKINFVGDSDEQPHFLPMVGLTLVVRPEITATEPDEHRITWDHFLGHLRWNLPPYIRETWPGASEEILTALNGLTHPLIGRLFPRPEQCLTRRQLLREYGLAPSDLARLPVMDGRRCGKHGFLRLYDPEHPRVRALIGVGHEELHGDNGGYDE
jgi:hypothetical protein